MYCDLKKNTGCKKKNLLGRTEQISAFVLGSPIYVCPLPQHKGYISPSLQIITVPGNCTYLIFLFFSTIENIMTIIYTLNNK